MTMLSTLKLCFFYLTKWLYDACGVEPHGDDMFKWACGNASPANWLYDAYGDDHVFERACGHLDNAKWLYDAYSDDHVFERACTNNNFEFARWLYSINAEDNHVSLPS